MMPIPQEASLPLLLSQHLAHSRHFTKGQRALLHLGPSSRLGLCIHPVQLLQALAQDILDVSHQLLHLRGSGSGLKDQPGRPRLCAPRQGLA